MKTLPKHKKKIILFSIFFTLHIAGIIFAIVQSLMPAEQSSEQSAWLTSLFEAFSSNGYLNLLGYKISLEDFSSILRKLVGHFGLFAFISLTGIISYLFVLNAKKSLLINLSVGFLLAILTELLQGLAPGRAPMTLDVILDSQGIVLANLFMYLLLFLFSKKQTISLIVCFLVCLTLGCILEILHLVFTNNLLSVSICNSLYIICLFFALILCFLKIILLKFNFKNK